MSKFITNFEEFKKELKTSPTLQEEFKNDPKRAVDQFEQKNPLDTDPWIYRIIVFALGSVILVIIIGTMILMSNGKITDDKNVPTIFTAIGSAAIGALAGLLAPSPRKGTNS